MKRLDVWDSFNNHKLSALISNSRINLVYEIEERLQLLISMILDLYY